MIYSFTELKKMSCEQLLSGIVTDKQTLMYHKQKLNLFDKQFTIVATTTSDTNKKLGFP
jgi:hypothetical protein